MSDGIKGTSNDTAGGKWWEVEEQSVDKSQETSQPEKSEADEEVVLGVKDTVVGRAHESAYDELIERGRDQGLSDSELAEKVEEEIPVTALARGHGEEVFDVESSRAARALGDMAERLADRDSLRSNTVPSQVSQTVNDRNMGRDELVELMAHPGQFREHLVEITGDFDLADEILEEVGGIAMRRTTRSILTRAESTLDEAMGHLDQLNANSESRRAFLAGVAIQSDSRSEIAEALENFGVSRSDAADMAEVLNEIRIDDSARKEFLNGDEGPNSSWRPGSSGDYASLETEFESNLDDAREGMERLKENLKNQHVSGNAELLTEDLIAPIRDEVLADVGAVTSPPEDVNELGEFFLDGIEGFERSQKRQDIIIGTINVGASIGVTLVTGGVAAAGLAAGIATAGAQSGISVADAQLDTALAQGAVNAQLADPELLAQAGRDENVAYALAAADILTAGVAGAAGTTKADVAGEVVGGGLEAYDVQR